MLFGKTKRRSALKKVKQLSVFLANKPGVLARVCAVLAKKKINISGISVVDAHDHAVARMITSDSQAAVDFLEDAGILVVENDVLMVRLPNRTGSLGAISRVLAAAKINIEYSYCTAGEGEKNAYLVMSVSDVHAAEKVLKKLLIKR